MVFTALIGGAATVGAATIGGLAQSNAAQTAADTQMNMYNQTQGNLQPFINAGASQIGNWQNAVNEATQPFSMTQAQLEQTPGYQFQLDQGLKAVQNSYAAQGLANSGAALKGAANYATGLANSNYQQQFNNYLTQNAQRANIAQNAVALGQNAAAGLGMNALQTGQGVAQTQASAGNAIAGAVNAAGVGIANTANNYALYNMLGSNNSFGTAGANDYYNLFTSATPGFG